MSDFIGHYPLGSIGGGAVVGKVLTLSEVTRVRQRAPRPAKSERGDCFQLVVGQTHGAKEGVPAWVGVEVL